jgi:hypothetical protein
MPIQGARFRHRLAHRAKGAEPRRSVTMNVSTLKLPGLLLLLALPLAVQASRSDAQTALTQAGSGVAAAERSGAASAAPVELDLARGNLLQAERSCERRDWDVCERAARRAHADARLAEARTRQHQAESATRRIEAAVDTLRTELARQGG